MPRVDEVDVYYIHAPDASIPLEDQPRGINTAHTAGHFKRFGLSNFIPADVQRVYSAVARKPEAALIPLLRKLGIALYIYSLISSGLHHQKWEYLLRERERVERFSKGGPMKVLYGGLYDKPLYHTALDLWAEAAAEPGCSKAELAYRWVAFDSALDAKYAWARGREDDCG
ncbi:NADP-dependent oxidoreductase domain-containing protein [Mycena metata]|uniref:NADP-dependent oxidoreductase domain-containing protein n=1 Tax=Mycena metata TaxID=1033252 RepID=A0AAD7MTI2_9AGAR|nr:NADP-dependent oxidoreductase domain-containing protein [Mycena metata]